MREKRQSVRTPFTATVKLSHIESGEFVLRTGNISDTGIYVLAEGKEVPAVGHEVAVQVQGLPGMDAPILRMRVVREDKEGIGLVNLD